MLPLIDKPLLYYALEEALCSGIEEFIFIIRKKKSSIQSYLEHFQLISQKNMHYVYQENPLGLGHAISRARDFINDELSMHRYLPTKIVIKRLIRYFFVLLP